MKLIEASPTLESLQRLLEVARSAPVPNESLVRQIRSLVFGERLLAIAFPDMASPPKKETCRAFLRYLREKDSKTLLDFEELLIQAGYSRWVSESHLEALLEAQEWNHPVVILGYSFSRAQLPELIHIMSGWVRNRNHDDRQRCRRVLEKLLATQQLEDRARRRRQRARAG